MHISYKYLCAYYKMNGGVELKPVANSVVRALSKVELWDSSVPRAPGADSWLVQSHFVVQLNLPSTFDSCGFLFPWLPRWLRWNVLLLQSPAPELLLRNVAVQSPHAPAVSHHCLGVSGRRALMRYRAQMGCILYQTLLFSLATMLLFIWRAAACSHMPVHFYFV